MNIQIADPEFNILGRIDVLLGVDIFVNVLLNGWWVGAIGNRVGLGSSWEK